MVEAEQAVHAVEEVTGSIAMTGAVTWPQLIFIVGIIVAVVVLTLMAILWIVKKINDVDSHVTENVAEMRSDFAKQLQETRHGFYGRTDTMGLRFDEDIEGIEKQIGETGLAIRQKITEVELTMRDKFVSSEHFGQIIKMWERQIDGLIAKFDAGMQRFENKLDRQTQK